MAQRYSLQTPTIAQIPDDGSHGTMLIPKDSIVEVFSELGNRRGLIPVTLAGHLILMFAEDIRERGTLLPPKQEARSGEAGNGEG